MNSDAAVYMESTDFGPNTASPTNLNSTFGNFLDDHGIVGVVDIAGADFNDYVTVSVAPNSLTTIEFRASSTATNPYFGMNVFSASGSYITGNSISAMPEPGTTYESSVSFITPTDGIIMFGTNHEQGSGTINYSIGVIPEPTSALLGAAGLAAAALRRRRSAN